MIEAVRHLPTVLTARRVLIVEDEYMVAYEIADALAAAGAEVLGPVPRVDDAMRLIETAGRIDAALLDVNLGRETVWPVVDTLLKRDITLLLATGYDAIAIPQAYAHLPRHEKPACAASLVQMLVRLLAPNGER